MVVGKPIAKPLNSRVASQIDLMPGDIALGTSGTHMRTLLGSCVSVILTDPRHTIAAMNHIVHVGRPNAANQENTAYGSVSMHQMFKRLQGAGINARMCDAYVYGGGNMFPHLFQERHVGTSNAAWVEQFLRNEGIRVVDQLTGGSGYRKISWTVGVGEPLVETVLASAGDPHVR